MREDRFRICGNCGEYRKKDRYHGLCACKCELRVEMGQVGQYNMIVRWNEDARNCDKFRGA